MNDTVFDKLKSMSIDELAEWINQCDQGVTPPWIEWLDNNYCVKCDTIRAFVPDYGRDCNFFWCELNGSCKYFPDVNGVSDDKTIIKAWLESQSE